MLIYELERVLGKNRMDGIRVGLFKAGHVEDVYLKEVENNQA